MTKRLSHEEIKEIISQAGYLDEQKVVVEFEKRDSLLVQIMLSRIKMNINHVKLISLQPSIKILNLAKQDSVFMPMVKLKRNWILWYFLKGNSWQENH